MYETNLEFPIKKKRRRTRRTYSFLEEELGLNNSQIKLYRNIRRLKRIFLKDFSTGWSRMHDHRTLKVLIQKKLVSVRSFKRDKRLKIITFCKYPK